MTSKKKLKQEIFPISVSLVIPLFNNETTASSQLRICKKIFKSFCSEYEMILCDDKSMDKTSSIIKKLFKNDRHVHFIFHRINLGIARTIFSLYKKAKYEYVVLFSVDGDWNPYDIKRLLTSAYINDADIVVGQRKTKTNSRYRRVVSFFYNFLPKLLFEIETFDAGSIKVIRKDLIDSISIYSKSVFFEAEMILKASKRGYKVISEPVDFQTRNRGGTGGRFSLVLQSLIDLIRLRISGLQ